jgi:hypothetical protein
MGILQLPMPLPAQIGILPATRKMVTTDNLATITTAGYLNAVNLESYPLAQTDTIECLYSFNTTTNAGTYGRFNVAIANGVITLSQTVTSGTVTVTGAVVSGNVPAFSGTTGGVVDSGIVATNVQLKTGVHAGSAAWAGGATSHAFTIAGLTTSSIVIPAIQAQTTGTVVIDSYTVTANTLTVTFSADPGAMVLQYVAYIAAQ